MAATIPMICGTVGTAAYRMREMTHMMTGAQASASGATIMALPYRLAYTSVNAPMAFKI